MHPALESTGAILAILAVVVLLLVFGEPVIRWLVHLPPEDDEQ